ncbi:MAG: hypothetical protein FWC86_02735 [Coriobacteriia bacterium]|nr:hypothetical protein [Coriobacteriia bacterium]
MKYCPHCNEELAEQTACCGGCGQQLEQEPPEDASLDLQDTSDVSEPAEEKPSKKKRGKLYALVTIALAAIVIALIYVLPAALEDGTDDDQGTSSEIILSPDLVIYDSDTSPFAVLESDEDFVIVSSLEGIDEASVLAAGISDETPVGLLRLIDSIEEVGEGFKLITSPAALTDAIEQCDVTFVVEIAEDGDFEVNYPNSEASSLFLIPVAHASSPPNNLLSRETGFGTLRAGMRIEGHLRIRNFEVDMRVVLRCYIGAEATVDSISWEQRLKTLNKPFSFMVGPLPVVLDNRLAVDASFEAQADLLSIELSAALDKSIGFQYTSRQGLQAVREDNSHWPQARVGPNGEIFSISAEAKLEVTLSSRLYGLAGPNLSAALVGDVSATLSRISQDSATAGAIELPGTDWMLAGSYTEKVTVPISGRFILAIPDFNPFSRRDTVELANHELFNTRDAITLLDVNLEFGHPVANEIEANMPPAFRSILYVWQNALEECIGDMASDDLGDWQTPADVSHIDFGHIGGSLIEWRNHENPVLRYAIEDLNGDGSPNLIIGFGCGAVYSYQDGRARYIFEGYEDGGFWARNHLTISGDGYFSVRGSGGWNSWRRYLYRLNSRGGVDLIAAIGVQPGIFDRDVSVWENFLTGEIYGEVEVDSLGMITNGTEYERVFGRHIEDISEAFDWQVFSTED